MLHSIEIKLKLPEGTKVNFSMGSVMHGALMEIVGSETAEWLHRISATRPFSQAIYYDKEKQAPIWRICALNQIADAKIIEPVKGKIGGLVTLRQKGYSILLEEIVSEEVTSYREIADKIFLADKAPDGYDITLVTPTSFKRDGKFVIMPELYLFYQSLLKRWNIFTDSNIIEEDNLDKFLGSISMISRYQLMSKQFSLENSRVKSFYGNMRIRLNGNDMTRRIAGLLMEYASFSGIGIKTALGMGAVKTSMYYRVPHQQEKA